MNESINDGGPAFPQHLSATVSKEWLEKVGQQGMSLRDWFAGMPLNELETDILRQHYEAKHPGSLCYSFQELRYFNADAMLEIRQTCPQP